VLKTDGYTGLKGSDFEDRDLHFGSNMKDTVRPTSKLFKTNVKVSALYSLELWMT
jgi:hypothetical protein